MGSEQRLSGATMTARDLSGATGMEKTRAGAITVVHSSDERDGILPGPPSATMSGKNRNAHNRHHFFMADDLEQGPLIRNGASVEVLYCVGMALGKDFPDPAPSIQLQAGKGRRTGSQVAPLSRRRPSESRGSTIARDPGLHRHDDHQLCARKELPEITQITGRST
jgi:hypothetical protein